MSSLPASIDSVRTARPVTVRSDSARKATALTDSTGEKEAVAGAASTALATQQERVDGLPSALRTVDLRAWYGSTEALHGITLPFPERRVTAIIGPSGCGKSTLLRCLNRMHELSPGGRVAGQVLLGEEDVYGPDVDPVEMRRHVGMVFQRPNPFPTMSIFDNVAAALRWTGMRGRAAVAQRVEEALRMAALWDEVKDRLHENALGLSGGQQQRLCIARALAVEPRILLMDEPASALDPISTGHVEELIQQLKQKYTIIIVTHNMQQAARVSDYTVFMLLGELVEFAPTEKLFTTPSDPRSEAYITGRFG
ncbi:MAG: phosphate ABC transporter ATP-binding protein [Limnochordaceae bacterium]|nr:phosphate ABC transporter ATP-binding protein [Limnochordaceae bacterium]